MIKKIQILMTICMVSACASPISENKPAEIKQADKLSDSQNELVLDSSTLPAEMAFTESIDNLDDEITGTSSSGTFTLSTSQVGANLSFGSNFYGAIQGSKSFELSYERKSGDYIYAYIWYYHSKNKRFEVLNNGWHYNSKYPYNYKDTILLPEQASHIYVGFFSNGGGVVSAQLTQQGTSVSTNSSGLETKFKTAQNRSGSFLGNPKGSIVRASTANAYKQDFDKGIILLKDGASEAYCIYGDIYQKWLKTGTTERYGLPVSHIQTGRVVNEKPSQYQLFDKPGDPSLHSWSGGTYMFLSGLRNIWNQGENANNLGHPTSDEINGKQSFEKGKIVWSNNSGQVLLDNASGGCNASLVANGVSSLCWPFSEPKDNNWNVATGSIYHYNDDKYADDWNWGSGNNDRGQKIYSATSGTVIYKGYYNGYGNQFIIQTGDFAVRYAHMQNLNSNLKVGSEVMPRTFIGEVSDSGFTNNCKAPNWACTHLHLVLYQNIGSGNALSNLKKGWVPSGSLSTGGNATNYAAKFNIK